MDWQFGWPILTIDRWQEMRNPPLSSPPSFYRCSVPFFYSGSLILSNSNVFSPFPLPRYFCKHLTPERAILQYWDDSPRWAIVPSCALPAILWICVLVKFCQICATRSSGPTFCVSRSASFSGVEMVFSVCSPRIFGTHVKLSPVVCASRRFHSPVLELRSHESRVPEKRASKLTLPS